VRTYGNKAGLYRRCLLVGLVSSGLIGPIRKIAFDFYLKCCIVQNEVLCELMRTLHEIGGQGGNGVGFAVPIFFATFVTTIYPM
jgi:hypothetical protein